MKDQNWHNLTVAETLDRTASRLEGLRREEAQRRLVEYGPNEMQREKKASPWRMFLGQFKSVLIIILLVAAAISAVLAAIGEGESLWDPIIIVVVVAVSVVLGFIQEYRAERALEALRQMIAPTSAVIRDGEETMEPSRGLVPGDVIVLRTGDRVAADARLLEVVGMKMDEAALTGESVTVGKVSGPLPADAALGDRRNMVYAGTSVAYGRGKAVVTATGMNTEFGRIAGMLQGVEEPRTPLQASLDRFGKMMAASLLAVSALVVILVLLRLKLDVLDILIWGVSLAVVVVPESLPVIVTVTLAFGVYRMAKKHALVRKLHAVETLGCTTFICSDKTGTLTQNQMTVRKIHVDGQEIGVGGTGYEPRGEFRRNGDLVAAKDGSALHRLLLIAALCNDAGLVASDGEWSVRGDSTEGALIAVSGKAGLDPEVLSKMMPRIGEIPFSSERKMMTTIHQSPEGGLACTKGALEMVLDACSRIETEGRVRGLLTEDREQVLEVNKQMAADGLRVLSMAYKPVQRDSWTPEEVEREMVFVGLVGMIDPPREEARQAIETCQAAGMKAAMITGDHKATAVAIATELGLLRGGLAVSGADLEGMTDRDLEETVEKIEVYARVSPVHKLRVVEALQKRGHVVAMTGDGVNDAPALKRADIGVAMGVTGTDVSKEAAHMVLTDDNFASIVAAVKEGRSIFSNIQKCIMYLLSCHIGELVLMVLAVLVGTPLPLVAVQLLFVNIATDGPPALALAFDPPDPDVMDRPPRDPRKGIFAGPVTRMIVLMAAWTGLTTFGVFYWALHYTGRTGEEARIYAQAMCFVNLLLIEKFTALSCRSERDTVFKIGFFGNKWLLLAIVGTMALSLPIIYVPSLQDYFHTYSLSLADWGIVALASCTLFVAVEGAKLFWKWREGVSSGQGHKSPG
ncbi:MAG: cation-translocating P-type ATPase [Chloroflexi bacterium]|nr:cation-translocating P-type ATPase [Chloroflexota bacterium]